VSRVVAIVQARMGSERLPGKVLLDVSGKPLLLHCIERISRAKRIDQVVLATTTKPEDKALVDLAKSAGIPAYAGSEDDVLRRYREAAEFAKADVIVRITGDCPLIDPELADRVVEAWLDSGVDLASNVVERTYPRGVDTEVFSMDLLRYLDRFVTKQPEREHVTLHLYKNREQFGIASVETDGPLNRPDLRLCVDTDEDLRLVRAVFEELGKEGNAYSTLDVVELFNRRPELAEINAGISQKTA